MKSSSLLSIFDKLESVKQGNNDESNDVLGKIIVLLIPRKRNRKS